LATPVQFLTGVGPQRAELLGRLGLQTACDVLFQFPRDYQDLTDLRAIRDLEEDRLQSVEGQVVDVDLRETGPGRSLLGVLVREENHYLRAIWFNQPFLRTRFKAGQRLVLSGKPRLNQMRWEIVHPDVQWLEPEETAPPGKLLPVYPLTEGLAQGAMRRISQGVVESLCDAVEEALPADFLAAHRLSPIQTALRQIHFPDSHESLAAARRRFVYQELFVLQLALALKRQQSRQDAHAPPLVSTAKIDARIRRLFPFTLTGGQETAIREVAADLARPIPMHRLLQGDVGSGKTAVALYAMLLAVAHGRQAVLMAPTEVLAVQHAQTLGRLLEQGRVRTGLLTGGLSAGDRQRLLAQTAAGELDILIGTQAIVLAGVEFAKLGLVVIDEQHKFGVRQRAMLKQAGADPHYLVMTATPIPRTVALTLYGDLDVSTLREAPPGRQTLHSYAPAPEQRASWWEFYRKKLREGRQGYVIAPLVEDSEQADATSVATLFEQLANGELEEFRLGLIHGRLSSAEKAEAMDRFRDGETQVLVATSVIEVGVDIPNATLMTIEGGERFGLAQLHQLRGRVSRGNFSGYCAVFAAPETPAAAARLKAFVESTDGFVLAEADFSLRGPGDLFGTKQHGLPPLRIANLQTDQEVLDEARRDAQQIVVADPGLQQPDLARLRRIVFARYGQALDLGAIG
jgi:ATP-dependent DNA helicase RecG